MSELLFVNLLSSCCVREVFVFVLSTRLHFGRKGRLGRLGARRCLVFVLRRLPDRVETSTRRTGSPRGPYGVSWLLRSTQGRFHIKLGKTKRSDGDRGKVSVSVSGEVLLRDRRIVGRDEEWRWKVGSEVGEQTSGERFIVRRRTGRTCVH